MVANVLSEKSVTLETSQSPIAPFPSGLQDPSALSTKQASTAICKVALSAGANVHFVSSFLTEDIAVVPVGQVLHEAACEKVTSGLDMYVPAEQQPRRALLPSKTCDE